MLEFGGGPCIHTLISASPFVRKIVFAEFTEANRKEVEAWQKRESSSHNWSPIVNYVVQKLEGKSQEEATKREEELRMNISRIVPCDIGQTIPLLHLSKSSTTDRQMFDIVSTSLCLEAAVDSDISYCEAVGKLSQLVKPDSQLIMVGVLNDSFYKVGDQKFRSFPLNESLVQRALHEAGIKDVMIVSSNRGLPKERTVSGFDGFFFAAV